MTPERYVQCLEILRWTNETLAEALGCDRCQTQSWAVGLETVPPEVSQWLEELVSGHQEVNRFKPRITKAEFATDQQSCKCSQR